MSKQRDIGTQFETLMLGLVQEYQPYAHRLGMQGSNDKGDIWIPDDRYVIECKRVKQMNLSGWLKEAEVEARNAKVPHGIVLHKRFGVGIADLQYATMTARTFFELAYNNPRT